MMGDKLKVETFSQAVACLLTNTAILDGEAHDLEVELQIRLANNLGISKDTLKDSSDMNVIEAIAWIDKNINKEGKELAHEAISLMIVADVEVDDRENELQKVCSDVWGIS
jgi:uncharacterized tellurite resistance protein B-like protein